MDYIQQQHQHVLRNQQVRINEGKMEQAAARHCE
jgi:hypothetical protein